jgi:hypothetical protein
VNDGSVERQGRKSGHKLRANRRWKLIILLNLTALNWTDLQPIEEKQMISVMAVVAATLFASAARADDMRRVVTGLDERNHSVVLFDNRMPLNSVAPGIVATNFWITDSYPPSLSKQDPSARPIGTAPPDNGTKFRSLSSRRSIRRPRPRCRQT